MNISRLVSHFLVVSGLIISATLLNIHPSPAQEDDLPEITRWTDDSVYPDIYYPYVPGTSHYLRDKPSARFLGRIVLQARASLAACDEFLFELAVNRLREIAQGYSQAGATSGDFNTRMDAITIGEIAGDLRREWDAEQPCDRKTADTNPVLRKQADDSIMDEIPRDSWRPNKPEQQADDGRKDSRRTFAGEWESGWGRVTIGNSKGGIAGTFKAYKDLPDIPKTALSFSAQSGSGAKAKGTISYNPAHLAEGVLPSGEIQLTLSADGNHIDGKITMTQRLRGTEHTIENTLKFRRCGPGLPTCMAAVESAEIQTNPADEQTCPEDLYATYVVSADYHRVNAESLEAEARSFDRLAQSEAERANAWEQLAETTSRDGNEDLAAEYRQKAAASRQARLNYERLASERRSLAEAERQKMQTAEARQSSRQLRSTPIDCPVLGSKVAVAAPDSPVSGSVRQESTRLTCGPDVTSHVLGSLDRLYKRQWLNWDEGHRRKICDSMVIPPMALAAWDINALSPDHAILPEDKFTPQPVEPTYQDHVNGDHWFEAISPNCAKPKESICRSSVTFLNRCIHAQVVNYILWGFSVELCDRNLPTDRLMHTLRNVWSRTPYTIDDSQDMMSELGIEYGRQVKSGRAGPGSAAQLELLMTRYESSAYPKFQGFNHRAEAACELTCRLTAEEEESLRFRNWSASIGNTTRLQSVILNQPQFGGPRYFGLGDLFGDK